MTHVTETKVRERLAAALELGDPSATFQLKPGDSAWHPTPGQEIAAVGRPAAVDYRELDGEIIAQHDATQRKAPTPG